MTHLQELLREMVDDLQDLRANLAALAVQPSTTALSLAAKKQAMKDNQKSYDALREKIEGLSL
jgi:hypothetical protein